MNWGQIGVNPATIPCEAANAVQAWVEKGLVVGRFLVVEPTGLEPVTPCLQSRCAASCAMAPHDLLMRVSLALGPHQAIHDRTPMRISD